MFGIDFTPERISISNVVKRVAGKRSDDKIIKEKKKKSTALFNMTRIIRFTGFMLYSFQWCYLTIAPTKNSRVYIECAIFNKRFLGKKNTHFERTFRAFEEFVYMQITGSLYGFFFLSFNSLSLKSRLIELFYEKIWFIPNIFKWDVSNRYRLFPPYFRICKFFSSSSLCRTLK